MSKTLTTRTAATAPTAPTVEQLTAGFKAAVEAAIEADKNKEDGGTCNLDNAILQVSSRYRSRVMEAAVAAGVTCRDFTWFKKSCFIVRVSGTGGGQANHRTRVAKAICKALEDAGLPAGMYYQMD